VAAHGEARHAGMRRRFAALPRELRETLTAVASAGDGVSAAALGVPEGTPLLAVDRIAFTFGGRPVEMRRGLCSTRHHHYLNELQ
jgi:GntR family transcriptional regulator